MSNFTPKLEGTIDDVKAILEQANSDYKAKYEAIIDKTSPVLVKYSGIKLWQLCNSTFKTREIFAKYNQNIQDKLADDYLGRVDTHGTEIAINQHNDIELQAQLWNALYENAVAEPPVQAAPVAEAAPEEPAVGIPDSLKKKAEEKHGAEDT